MIDCGESDGMIEICGKLDKSNSHLLIDRKTQKTVSV